MGHSVWKVQFDNLHEPPLSIKDSGVARIVEGPYSVVASRKQRGTTLFFSLLDKNDLKGLEMFTSANQ